MNIEPFTFSAETIDFLRAELDGILNCVEQSEASKRLPPLSNQSRIELINLAEALKFSYNSCLITIQKK